MHIVSRFRSLWPVAVVVFLSAAVFALFSQNPIPALVLALFVCFAVALFAYPKPGLFLLLAARPAMDILGDRTIVLFDYIPVNIAAATGVLAIGWCALVLLEKKTPLSNKPMFWSFVALLGISATSLLWTQSMANSAYELIRLVSIIGIYLVACAVMTTREQFIRFLRTLAVSLIVPVVFGLYQIATHAGFTFFDLSNRAYGTFGHPNVFGFYLVLSLSMLSAFYYSQRRAYRISAMLGFVVLIALLALTYTRGAWLGMFIALFVVGIARIPKAVLAAVIVGAIVYLSAPAVSRWTFVNFGVDLGRMPVISRLTRNSDEANSIDWRFGVWHEMAAKFRERPLLGYGLGSFTKVRELQVNNYYASTEAHNDYLRLAVETGVIGLGIYTVLLFFVARALIRTYRSLAGSSYQFVALGMLGFFVGFLVMSFFDNLLQGTPVMWAMWASLAGVLNVPVWAGTEHGPQGLSEG